MIAAGSVLNRETVSGDLYGPATKIRSEGNPASTAVVSSPAADLGITKTDGVTSVLAGEELTYTL